MCGRQRFPAQCYIPILIHKSNDGTRTVVTVYVLNCGSHIPCSSFIWIIRKTRISIGKKNIVTIMVRYCPQPGPVQSEAAYKTSRDESRFQFINYINSQYIFFVSVDRIGQCIPQNRSLGETILPNIRFWTSEDDVKIWL